MRTVGRNSLVDMPSMTGDLLQPDIYTNIAANWCPSLPSGAHTQSGLQRETQPSIGLHIHTTPQAHVATQGLSQGNCFLHLIAH
eukprot:5841939-Alexandrium_andersonii.AAC.1